MVLIEKNEKVGRKLAITGKGRCNITNACEVEELIANVPVNGKFLYSAIYGFTNQDVIAFFNQLGVPTKVERGGRVFPVSDKAYDVVDAMLRFLREQKVKLIQAEVGALRVEDGAVRGVTLANGDKMDADCVLVATGGKSYPKTGSTGDGFALCPAGGAHHNRAFALAGAPCFARRLGAGLDGPFFEKRGGARVRWGGAAGVWRDGGNACYPFRL